jgi:lysozyme family protein
MLILNNQLKLSYESLFSTCQVNKSSEADANSIISKIINNRARYQTVAITLNIPWYVIAVIHSLEASLNFNRHLHNGDPLTQRTIHVPAGRPITGNPPFSWEESAADALRLEGLDHWTDWSVAGIAYKLERYNGTGYRAHGINSPYLWGGTNNYSSGKYVQDNVFSSTAVSKQLGGMVLIKLMIDGKMIESITEESTAAITN